MLRIFKRKYSINLSEYEPRSSVRVINSTNKDVKKVMVKGINKEKAAKRNPVGIQMISENLYRQIFGKSRNPSFNAELVEK